MIALTIDFGVEDLGRAAMGFKDLLNVADYAGMTLLKEDQNTRASAAKAATE